MKQLILPLFFLLTLNIYSEEPFVQIYQTHDNGIYGRSEDRDIVLSVKESVFKRFSSLEVDPEIDTLTAVVIRSYVVNELEMLFKDRDSIQIGYVNISKKGNIYRLQDDNILLDMSFSFEKPNDYIIKAIEDHYPQTSKYRKIVSGHYKENYVIKIHRAENILSPEAEEVTYDEALVMATIIGDKDQWLWGIHDGCGYLETLLLD